MVPLASLMKISQTYGPDQVVRYNGFTAADISGSPAPGYSSDQAMAAIERVAAETLPPGMTYEWTDLTYQQIIAGNSCSLDPAALRSPGVLRIGRSVRERDAAIGHHPHHPDERLLSVAGRVAHAG